MKRGLGILLTAALVGAICCSANAGEKTRKRDGSGRADIVKEFDKDGDGKLSEEERTAARDAMKAKMEERRAECIEKYDTDGDGKLSDEEKTAAREARRAELIQKFDKDGDGKLSDEERAAAREERGDSNRRRCTCSGRRRNGNNGVGNGTDPQPPGNPRVNDGPGTGPGTPGTLTR